MSDRLPERTKPTELMRAEGPQGGWARVDEHDLPSRAGADDGGLPALVEPGAFGVTNNNIQAVSGHTVHVTVKQEVTHYHAPVTQNIRHEVNHVEQTRLDYRHSERIDYRQNRLAPTLSRPAYGSMGDELPRGLIGLLLLGVFGLLAFIVVIFVVVSGFRAVASPTTIVVPSAEESVPGTFQEYLESRGR